MKVAVSATGPSLDSSIDPRFGRCPYFVLADIHESNTRVASVRNANESLGGGAGIRSAQLLVDNGASVVLTGECGPKAAQALGAAGIEVIVGCSGTVAQVLQQFRSGALGRK